MGSGLSNSLAAPGAALAADGTVSSEFADDLMVEAKVYHCTSSKTRFSAFQITPAGVLIVGSSPPTTTHPPLPDVGQLYANAIGASLPRYELSDARACQLLIVSHLMSFYAIPAPEAFSRHSGTCRMLGDRNHGAAVHGLRVGDVLRVGSVGLVVTEVHCGEMGGYHFLPDDTVDRLVRDTAVAVKSDDMTSSMNGELIQEGEVGVATEAQGGTPVAGPIGTPMAGATGSGFKTSSDNGSGGTEDSASECDEKTCYMCFDDHNEEENPLVSPCNCIGDTQFVHVDCLRRWHKSGTESEICAVSSVMASCSVCKCTYRSQLTLPNGTVAPLFNSELKAPFISFLVVTKHEMAKGLFNTRFQLSFSSVLKPDGLNSTRDLQIGRSSTSDMILDYRTVSAHHAHIRFKNGEFQFIDSGSSNGSYLYLRKPVELKVGSTTNLRLGRTLLSLKVVQKGVPSRIIRGIRSSVGGVGGKRGSGLFARGEEVEGAGDYKVKVNTPEHYELIQSLAKSQHTGAEVLEEPKKQEPMVDEPPAAAPELKVGSTTNLRLERTLLSLKVAKRGIPSLIIQGIESSVGDGVVGEAMDEEAAVMSPLQLARRTTVFTVEQSFIAQAESEYAAMNESSPPAMDESSPPAMDESSPPAMDASSPPAMDESSPRAADPRAAETVEEQKLG